MKAPSRFGRAGRAALLLLVAALAAVALVGCGGTKESPGGPSGTGAQEVKAVPDSVRAQVLDTLKAGGYSFDPLYIAVQYGASDKQLVVTGPIKGPKGSPSLSTVVMELTGGKLAVKSAK